MVKFFVLPEGQHRTVRDTVKFMYPSEDGTLVAHEFKAEFRLLPDDEVEAILTSEAPAGEKALGRASSLFQAILNKDAQRALMREVWTGWSGIGDGASDDPKAELAFSEAARDRLLLDPIVYEAVTAAYMTLRSGRRAKN